MVTMVSTIKLAQLSADAVEMPQTKIRLPVAPPVALARFSASRVREITMGAGLLQPAFGPVCYKDQDDDFVLVTD